jgi:hypothetical protein
VTSTPIVTRNPSPTGTYLVIANATSFPNSSLFVYPIALNGYLRSDGTLLPLGAGTIPPLTLAATGDTIIPLPYMNSARVWISIGAPLQVGGGKQPGFDATTTQLYDWFEFNYGRSATGNGSLFINTTQVDMFGLPMTLKIDWTGGTQTVGIPSGQRAAIFAAMRADPTLSKLIVSAAGTDLRVMSLNHGIDSGLVPATYLDAYINAVWTYYQTNTMVYQPGGKGPISNANVVNNQLVFSGAISTSVAKPTSTQAIGGVSAVGSVAPFLTAGFNRGTLMPAQQPDVQPGTFYAVSPTNLFSKIIHQFSLNNLAYGFSYDDYGGFSSTVAPPSTPSAITVTLSAF